MDENRKKEKFSLSIPYLLKRFANRNSDRSDGPGDVGDASGDAKVKDDFGGRLKEIFSGFGKKKKANSEPETVDIVEIVAQKEKKTNYDGSKTFEIGRKKYALGLFWSPATTGESIVDTAEASSSGDGEGFNLFVDLRDREQVGLAEKSEGISTSHKPAVLCVPRRYVGNNWLAACQLDPLTYWVASVKNGIVFEDQVVRNVSEAQTLFFDLYEADEWDKVVCPEEWDIDGAVEAKLSDLLIGKAERGIKSIHPIKDNLVKIIVIAAILGGGYGVYSYFENQRRAAEEERQRLAQIEAQRIRLIPANFPWANNVSLTHFTNICRREIERTKIMASGWELSNISCLNMGERGGLIEGSMRPSGFPKAAHLDVAVALNNAEYPNEEPGTVEYTNAFGAAIYKRSFEIERNPESQKELPWPIDTIQSIIELRSQTAGINVTLSSQIERVTPAQMQRRREPVFNYDVFTISTGFGLMEVAELYSDIPAVTPTRLDYNFDSMSWKLSSFVYHPPITR